MKQERAQELLAEENFEQFIQEHYAEALRDANVLKLSEEDIANSHFLPKPAICMIQAVMLQLGDGRNGNSDADYQDNFSDLSLNYSRLKSIGYSPVEYIYGITSCNIAVFAMFNCLFRYTLAQPELYTKQNNWHYLGLFYSIRTDHIMTRLKQDHLNLLKEQLSTTADRAVRHFAKKINITLTNAKTGEEMPIRYSWQLIAEDIISAVCSDLINFVPSFYACEGKSDTTTKEKLRKLFHPTPEPTKTSVDEDSAMFWQMYN